jgi:hypothetical protein
LNGIVSSRQKELGSSSSLSSKAGGGSMETLNAKTSLGARGSTENVATRSRAPTDESQEGLKPNRLASKSSQELGRSKSLRASQDSLANGVVFPGCLLLNVFSSGLKERNHVPGHRRRGWERLGQACSPGFK